MSSMGAVMMMTMGAVTSVSGKTLLAETVIVTVSATAIVIILTETAIVTETMTTTASPRDAIELTRAPACLPVDSHFDLVVLP